MTQTTKEQLAEQILKKHIAWDCTDSDLEKWKRLNKNYTGIWNGAIAAIVEALSLSLQLPTDDQIEENGKEGGLKDGELQLYWEGAVWLRDVWIPKHTKVEALPYRVMLQDG